MESHTGDALPGFPSDVTPIETVPSSRSGIETTGSDREHSVAASRGVTSMESNVVQAIICSQSDVPTDQILPGSRSEITTIESPTDTVRTLSGSRSEATTTETAQDRPTKCKTNWCKYCDTMQTKIIRHMVNRHRETPEVQQYLQIKCSDRVKQKKRRRELCSVIINRANQIYNEKVINDEGAGKPITVKRGKVKVSSLSHVQCSTCGGLVTRKYFSSHTRTCEERQESGFVESLEEPRSMFLRPKLPEKYRPLEKHIFVKMVKDEVSLTAQTDPLILEFGRRFFKSHMAAKQRNYVSNKMRTLADLLIRLRTADPTNVKTMSDCVDPTNFDSLCAVVRRWSAYDEDNGVCGKGSVPRRVCKSLETCSRVLWSEAIKNKELTAEERKKIKKKHELFMALMDSDWLVEVNSAADKSIKIHRVAKETVMPLEDDIKTYFRQMTAVIKDGNTKLKTKHDLGSYSALTKACIAYLIAFNCRRPSEVTYATVDNFATLKTSAKNDNLSVFTVAATKNNVKVPIIVPLPAKVAINTLIEHRSRLNIRGKLLFGKGDGTAYNGGELISKFKSGMNLLKPDHCTANGFRHYWATVSQLDPRVKKHMPKFLGHTLSTHEKFYEMPMSDIHLGVIGPILSEHCLPDCPVDPTPSASFRESGLNVDPTPSTSFEKDASGNTFNEYSDEESRGACIRPIENSLASCIQRLVSNDDSDEEDADPYRDPTPSTSRDAPLRPTRSSSANSPFVQGVPFGESSDSEEDRASSHDTLADQSQNTRAESGYCHPSQPRETSTIRLRPRLVNASADQQVSPDEANDSDVSWHVPSDTATRHGTPDRPGQSDSSDTVDSPAGIGKRNNWLTPERQELYTGLPRTVLGLEHAGRGRIKSVWEKSRFIKHRHSLQTTRIEVSKYYTGKKRISTPIRTTLLDAVRKDHADTSGT